MLGYLRNCKGKLFNWTESEEEEVKTMEQKIKVNDMSYQSATDVLDESFQLYIWFFST